MPRMVERVVHIDMERLNTRVGAGRIKIKWNKSR